MSPFYYQLRYQVFTPTLASYYRWKIIYEISFVINNEMEIKKFQD